MNTPTTVVNDYLHRLAIDHVPLADLSSLRTLHRTHLATIPLEGPRRMRRRRRPPARTPQPHHPASARCTRHATEPGVRDAAGRPRLHRHPAHRHTEPTQQPPRDSPIGSCRAPRGGPLPGRCVRSRPDGPLLLQDKQGQAASIDGFEIRMPDGALGVRGSDGPRYRVAAARGLMDALEPDALIRSKAVRPQIGEEAPVLSIRRQRGRTTLIGDHLIETNGTARTDVLLAPNQGARVIRERFGVVPSAREERCLWR